MNLIRNGNREIKRKNRLRTEKQKNSKTLRPGAVLNRHYYRKAVNTFRRYEMKRLFVADTHFFMTTRLPLESRIPEMSAVKDEGRSPP